MHYVIEVADEYHATLNGQPLNVPAGMSASSAALRAAELTAQRDVPADTIATLHAMTPEDSYDLAILNGKAMSVDAAHAALAPHQAQEAPLPPTEADQAPAAALGEQWQNSEPQHPEPALTEPTSTPHQGQVNRRALLAGGGAALLLAGIAGVALTRGEGQHKPPAKASSTPTPALPLLSGQSAPAGWRQTAVWKIENVADPHPRVAVMEHRLYVVTIPPGTGTQALLCADARTGQPIWQRALTPTDVLTDGPHLITHRGRKNLAIATQTHLIAWDARSGKETVRAKLPQEGAVVGFSARGPWVHIEGQRYAALDGSRLVTHALPKGSAPYGVLDDGRLIAVNGKNEMRLLTAGKEHPAVKKLSSPKGSTPGAVVTVTDDLFVTSWNNGKETRLRAYELTTGQEKWTTTPQSRWGAFIGTTLVAPDQTWATVDNRTVDLTNGNVHVMAAKWTPQAISDTWAWGSDGTFTLTTDRRGKIVSPTPKKDGSTPLEPKGGADALLYAAGSIDTATTLFAVTRTT